MGKKQQKGKKFSKRKQISVPTFPISGLKYQTISSPFEGMSQEDIRKTLKEIGKKIDCQFEEAFKELQEQILSVDPYLLLSYFAAYDLSAPEGIDKELTEDDPILQHQVEILQGLILRHKFEEFEFKVPDLIVFHDLIKRVTRAYYLRRIANIEPGMTDDHFYRLQTLEEMRIQTQSVRNWGYPQQVTRIVCQLFEPLDDDIEQQRGVRITYLVKMCLKLIDIAEDRLNLHIKRFRPVMKAKTVSSAVEEYHRCITDLKSTPAELIGYLKDINASLRDVKLILISHASLRLQDIYTFTLPEIINAYPGTVDSERLLQIMEGWAFSFGDLLDRNPEHFFMANPIWQKPLIRIDKETFFWPIISLFFSFCLELMESIIKPNARLLSRYEDRRSKFLEQEIRNLFEAAFPSAELYLGSLWHDEVTGKDFENDLVAIIDSYFFVIEAKAGRITESARRGAELSLQRMIDDLLITPSIQCKRFVDHLLEKPGVHRFPTRRGEINEIDTSNVKQVGKLNITLEILPWLRSGWPKLRQAGFIPHETEIAPTMSLTDLELVFDLLEGSCQKLHYLVRRTQFEKNANYDGDELDLLAFYLDTGFNVGEAEFDGSHLSLWGMSLLFNPYFMARHGHKVQKPQRRMTEWWKNILRSIERRQVSRWTDLGYILLNVAYDDQMKFEIEVNVLKNIVRRRWKKPGHKNVIILLNGPQQRRDLIVGVAYKNMTREDRNQLMKNAVLDEMDKAGLNRAVVIGKDVDQWNYYPYNAIGCLIKSEEDRISEIK